MIPAKRKEGPIAYRTRVLANCTELSDNIYLITTRLENLRICYENYTIFLTWALRSSTFLYITYVLCPAVAVRQTVLGYAATYWGTDLDVSTDNISCNTYIENAR